MSVLEAAALAYAQDEGFYVFPLRPRGKTPLTEHGLDDATVDALTIETWWTKWPEANVAIRTGELVVIDEDEPGALVALAEKLGETIPETRRARTGKGHHYYFVQTNGARVRNTAGKLAPGVDTRGDGGYVVAPPSVHPDGGVYTWENDIAPAPLPDWMISLLAARPPRVEPALGNRSGATAYGQRALEQELHAVTVAPEGTRNDRLNTAAFNLGQLIAAGELDELEVTYTLHAAARGCGLPEREADVTIKSGLQAGLTQPRRPHDPLFSRTPLRVVSSSSPQIAESEIPASRLRFATGREFRKQTLARIDPLLGSGNDALMMPGSLLLLAGIGGAGKTTLAMHAIAHWSAGLPWFGIPMARPLRIVVIENEGPHDPFARKVDEFSERFRDCRCSGEPHGTAEGIDERTFFLDAPWGKFSFDDRGLAAELRAFVLETEADLVVANPLGRLGMKGAGTPEETREFLQLLANAGLNEDFAALLLHHLAKVNKLVPLVQQVSGDWGPHPDTIMILEEAGERTSKLSFGKVRWGDQGRQPLILRWLTDPDGPVGYHADSGIKVITDDELYLRIDEFIRTSERPPGVTKITRGVAGQNDRLRALLDRGAAEGRYHKTAGARPGYILAEMDVQEELDL